jgi:uncharacterized protein involved in exopolysaccharide biosynthesis/Mrp family chromosome partitioning ATPase
MEPTTSWNNVRLSDYFLLLRRQWVPLLLFLALGLGAAGAYLHTASPEYVARTAVLVSSTTAGVPDSVNRGSGAVNLDTEAQLVTSTEIVAAAAERMEGEVAPGELVERVRISVPPNTEILEISYVGGSPQEAQAGSLAFAEAYLDQRRAAGEAALEAEGAALQTRIDTVTEELSDILDSAADLPADSAARARAEDQATVLNNQLASLVSQQGQIRAASVSAGRIVTQPGLPTAPSSPDPLIALVAGGLLGLLVGVGVAALRQRSDDLLHAPNDLFRRTNVPVATVLGGRLQQGVVTLVQPLSSDGRGYARLRNLVTTSLAESNRRVVLVAGVRYGGGPVAANLAASLARSGEDVHLVCADVFGTTERSLLPGGSVPGLAEVLAGQRSLADVLRTPPGLPNLKVLGPGCDADRADALLQTRGPRTLVDELLRTSSYVVIEAPATADSSDAQTLANVAEIAVLVVELGQTRAREVLDACAQLESMGTPVLGAVVTRYERGGRAAGTTASPEIIEAGPKTSPSAAPAAEETAEPSSVDRRPAEPSSVNPPDTVGAVPARVAAAKSSRQEHQ